MRQIPVDLLSLSPLRGDRRPPRPDAALVDLVRRHGDVDPVVARPLGDGRFEILRNAEAWVAAQLAGRDTVRVDVRDDLDANAAGEFLRAVPTSGQAALDEARQFQELLGVRPRRGAMARLAATTGRAHPYISHALRLLRLPADVQDMIARDGLSAGHGRALAGLSESDQQRSLARRCLRGGWSVRELESRIRERRLGVDADPSDPAQVSPQPDPDAKHLERELSELVGLSVSVDSQNITFGFAGDLEVLDGFLERLGYRPEGG